MALTSDLDLKQLFPILFKQLLGWGPIVIGVVHQFLMYFFEIDRIPTFVNPPGDIYPWVSLEWQWWFVLIIGSSLIVIIAYSDRFGRIPSRVIYPFYAYLLFLLIFVKPV